MTRGSAGKHFPDKRLLIYYSEEEEGGGSYRKNIKHNTNNNRMGIVIDPIKAKISIISSHLVRCPFFFSFYTPLHCRVYKTSDWVWNVNVTMTRCLDLKNTTSWRAAESTENSRIIHGIVWRGNRIMAKKDKKWKTCFIQLLFTLVTQLRTWVQEGHLSRNVPFP